jgi:hypothetical protein
MSLGTHQFPLDEAGDIRAHTGDVAGELMSHSQWNRDRRLGPLIPLVDMEISSTYTGGMDLDQDLVGPWLGDCHIIESKTDLIRMFHQGAHRLLQTGFRMVPAER